MKKFLLPPCFLLLLSLFANAQQAVSIESSAVALESVSAAKSSINTAGASTAAAPAGKKKGFKDLFDNDNITNTAGPRLNPRAISFVEDYIEKNSSEKITAEDLAAVVSVGKRTLERRFKSATNK